MAKELLGAPVAQSLRQTYAKRAAHMREIGHTPCLAILRFGEHGDALSYARGIIRCCETVGADYRVFALPDVADHTLLHDTLQKINADDTIHGCIALRPFPDEQSGAIIREELCAEKDIDCMTELAMSRFEQGDARIFPPCTAQACMEILQYYGYATDGKNITVIGRSRAVGGPIAALLRRSGAVVTVCHSKTLDLSGDCRSGEIVVSAVGRAGLVHADCMRSGQVIIDVGMSVDSDGKLCGDVDAAAADSIVAAYTPVPRGVGAVTSAVLIGQVVRSAERFYKENK